MPRPHAVAPIVIWLISAVCLAGCEDDSFAPVTEEGLPKGAFLGDQILLGTSDPVEGFPVGDEVVFDLSEIPMVRDGTFNDFEISYWTATSCDENVWIYNYKSKTWGQIGFDNAPGTGCWDALYEQFHLLSAAGINGNDVLGPGWRIKLRLHSPPGSSAPQNERLQRRGDASIRALRINPDYLTLSLVGREPRHCYGLTFDGEALWVSERGRLLRLSTSGDLLGQYCAPGGWPTGLAFKGRVVLAADSEGGLRGVTLDGYSVGGWPLPTEYPGGLSYSAHRIWIGERYGSEPKIYGMVDTVTVDRSGRAYYDVPDTLEAPGGSCHGLAWDGEHLIVVSDSLYTITTAGAVLAAYSLPVADAEDIAWDGEAIWIVNRGPKDLASRDQVITRFRFR